MEKTKKCANCETFNEKDAMFCVKCGNSFNNEKQTEPKEVLNNKDESEENICPYCGSKIPNYVAKCKYCGEWIDKSKEPSISNKINSIIEKTDNTIHSSKSFNDIKDYLDSTSVKHCTKCGAPNFKDSKFCEKCGEEIY